MVSSGRPTGEGLIEFLDSAARRGALNPSTAATLRASVTQILDFESADLASINMQTLDVEDLLERFGRARGHRYRPTSLASYCARFRRAREMYLEFTKDPTGWRPPKGRTPRSARTTSKASAAVRGMNSGADTSPQTAPDDGQMLSFDFPLARGRTAHMRLPRQLENQDYDRLTRFLSGLVMDSAAE